MGYGLGYDEELPRGFQDADLEMAEFETRAADRRAAKRAKEREKSVSDWDAFAARCVATAGSEAYA